MITREGTKKILKTSIFSIIVVILIGYAYFAFKDYISGPQLIISEPQNGATFSDPLITIKGQALRIQDITLNNRPILIDEQGFFKETLLLLPGYNSSTIFAEDKFGRTTEYKLELVYQH